MEPKHSSDYLSPHRHPGTYTRPSQDGHYSPSQPPSMDASSTGPSSSPLTDDVDPADEQHPHDDWTLVPLFIKHHRHPSVAQRSRTPQSHCRTQSRGSRRVTDPHAAFPQTTTPPDPDHDYVAPTEPVIGFSNEQISSISFAFEDPDSSITQRLVGTSLTAFGNLRCYVKPPISPKKLQRGTPHPATQPPGRSPALLPARSRPPCPTNPMTALVIWNILTRRWTSAMTYRCASLLPQSVTRPRVRSRAPRNVRRNLFLRDLPLSLHCGAVPLSPPPNSPCMPLGLIPSDCFYSPQGVAVLLVPSLSSPLSPSLRVVFHLPSQQLFPPSVDNRVLRLVLDNYCGIQMLIQQKKAVDPKSLLL